MNRFSLVIAFSLLICVAPASAQQSGESPLTNTSVVKLVKAGFKDKIIIAIINNRPNTFRLDPDQLVELKRQGVSENVILAMLASEDPTYVLEGEEWANDAFFKGTKKSNNGGNDSGSTNIFGSSGSSQSQTQTRGGNGGNENEGSVTGSATVRIIKPPTEAGAPGAKLEKTPTLDNEGVIRLVEAGFSEGTIIKRIEGSPVEFDLSPAKVDELRRRRVTDPIIAAMNTAMGTDSRPK